MTRLGSLGSILVTGGAGFLGRYLAAAAAEAGSDVTVLDDLSCANSTFDCPELQDSRIRCIKGTVFDAPLVKELVERHAIVAHLASVVGVEETIGRTVNTIENLNGTMNVVRALRPDHVALFTSSADVYGLHSYHYDGRPMREDDCFLFEHALVNRWVYAHVKALEENLIANSPARSVVIRVFNTYGPAMDFPAPKRVMPHFIASVLSGAPLKLSGDGGQHRSFCHVSDMIRGFVLALEHAGAQRAPFAQCFNIGSPETLTIRQLAEHVLAGAIELGMLKGPLPIESDAFHYSQPFNDGWSRVPDISHAREVLGYAPRVAFRDGLRETLEYYRSFQPRGMTLASDVRAAGVMGHNGRSGTAAAEEAPRVTVVIVTYKRPHDVRSCLRSIERQTYPNLETIVVDNDSEGDKAATLGREFPTARIYQARSNVGLVRAQNAAVRLARGAYLLFLNDDTELVDENYIANAVGLFEGDPRLGAIGGEAVLDERQHVTGVLYLRLRANGVPERQNLYNLPEGALRETDILTGVHIFTRKALIERIGGFDPFYFLHYDDADSTYRIARLGYRLGIMGRAPVAHWHSPVARRWDVGLQGRNRLYFALKNLPWWRVLLLPLGDLWLVASRAANVPRLVRRVRTIEDPGEPSGLPSKKLEYARLKGGRRGGMAGAVREAVDRIGYALVEWFMGLLILFGGYVMVLPHVGRAVRARRSPPDFLAGADLSEFKRAEARDEDGEVLRRLGRADGARRLVEREREQGDVPSGSVALSGVPGSGRSGAPTDLRSEGTVHDLCPGVPRLPLPARDDPLGGALVPPVPHQLP